MTTQPPVERLAAIVGTQGLITDARDMEPYVVDWRRYYRGRTSAVVRPASTEEVAAVVQLCAETGTGIVPQGGNTGMCGGATPSAAGNEIVLAFGRMNRVLELDARPTTYGGTYVEYVERSGHEAPGVHS